MSDKTTYLCPQCQIGHLHPEQRAFIRVIDGMVLSVPDMPALVCDVCAFQDFEPKALAAVEALLLGRHGSRNRANRPSTRPLPPSDAATSQRLKP